MAALATRQHGVITRAQIEALGVSRRGIDRRLASGRLDPLYRGVYSVGHRAVSREARWLAAVLAIGPDAVLSHRSAAALWGLRPTSRAKIEVTAGRALRSRLGIQVHRAEV
ncbi:MAG TPA: type IV toxin-antitoxin system AbiEi family antitoxin domain-containing protein, partial [Solirubrobacteraceae bacterium]|nr:type IV toxin-antitoxin system AbiEi family antitoxin domain-containing protein [Solirubrobacteraceae bacterium]